MAQRLRAAKRPIIIAGRGAVVADVGALIEQVAAQCGALLATTLPAKGMFDGNEFGIGIAGGFASELAYELFNGCDLVVAIGASLSQHTVHGGKLFPNAFVVQIDLNPLGLQYGAPTSDLSLLCDARSGRGKSPNLCSAGSRPRKTIRANTRSSRARSIRATSSPRSTA